MRVEPTRCGALVDLVDRILVKGVILQADLVICVSGVPLIGVNLKAAIAGMTTMVDYGVMEVWDEKIRASVLADSEEEAPLNEDEQIIFKTVGSQYCQSTSLAGIWRTGFLYLTNQRLFLFRKEPGTVLFETALERIKSVTVEGKNEKEISLLLFESNRAVDKVMLLRTDERNELKNKIEERMVKVSSVLSSI